MNGGTASNGLPTFPMGLPHSAGSGKQRCLASGDLGVAVALQRTGLVMGAGPRLPGPKSARSRGGAGTTGAAACLLHVFVTHFRRDFAPGATRRGRTSEKPTPWMMSDAPGWGDDRKRITLRRQLGAHPAWRHWVVSYRVLPLPRQVGAQKRAAHQLVWRQKAFRLRPLLKYSSTRRHTSARLRRSGVELTGFSVTPPPQHPPPDSSRMRLV